MENKSIEKILNEMEIYSVVAIADNTDTIDNHVTLNRNLALLKAYDMYYKRKDAEYYYTIYVDTWKNDVMIKSEYIDDNEKLVVRYENYNV